MRREGNIIQEIIDHDNMSDSFDQVLRGTVRKKCREGQELLAHREEVIANLQREIADGTFTVSEYRERDIYEYGKHRRLQIVKMERRIGCHAIMRVVDRHLHRRFIRTTGASIKGRGTHDMMQQVSAVLRDNPHLKYAYQFDIISIRDLVNLQIIVHDFQLGVKTREGEDRCVVSIEMGGQMKKFITNSEEMKNVLSQISEIEDGFPFETTIKAMAFGNGKTKYVFT